MLKLQKKLRFLAIVPVLALAKSLDGSNCERSLNTPSMSLPGNYRIKVKAGQRPLGSSEKVSGFSTDDFLIVSGSSNVAVSREICKHLGTNPAPVELTKFTDGEISCILNQSVRGKDIYLVQSFGAPVNDNVMELMLTVTALRRSGANSITAVILYFGYKFHRNRGLPISTTYKTRFLWNAAADVAKMINVCGVDKVLSVDLQRPGQGHEACFFDNTVPTETIDSTSLFVDYLIKDVYPTIGKKGEKIKPRKVVILSPSTEFVKKAKRFQRKLQLRSQNELLVGYAAFLDDDMNDNTVTSTSTSAICKDEDDRLLGDVRGADVIIIDDVVGSGLGISDLCRRLKRSGAKSVYVCASHGVFSKNVMELIDLSGVEKVITTNSLPLPKHTRISKKIVQLDVSPLLAKVIETELYNKAGDSRADDHENVFEDSDEGDEITEDK